MEIPMNQLAKSILSLVLVLSMLLCATVPAFAVGGEEYICELRLVYAETYEEAAQILAFSDFCTYKLFHENLNEDTDEIGVWLAYKTTTNIEDAITDLAVMQMGGGYKEGNYQQMIKESYDEYVAMGEIYLDAIEYFTAAYDAGDFLAESAYRQLNFYNVETQKDIGLEVPHFEGELLGDIFCDGIDVHDLATMFLEGNSYALQNIRALIAMGVSYNEDGKTYLDKVAEAAEAMRENPDAFANEEYDHLADMIALSISSIRDVLHDLADHEANLNYADEEFTDEEIRYIEIKAIADEMRDIRYRDDQTLYDFFMKYDFGKDGKAPLYPLIAALNDGQVAMTKVAHYYDVLRYSVAVVDEALINQELEELEAIYAEDPFNIYTGVDRSIYNGTFALTTAADRADAYAEISLMDQFLGTEERRDAVDLTFTTSTIGVLLLGGACLLRHNENQLQSTLYMLYKNKLTNAANNVANLNAQGTSVATTYGDAIDELFFNAYYNYNGVAVDVNSVSFVNKVYFLRNHYIKDKVVLHAYKQMNEAKGQIAPVSSTAPVSLTTGIFFVAGGAMMLYSAYNILSTVYHYYHPDYDDIPIAMVDLVETVDGDRYIKYDVVFEVETRKDGNYSAGDLNAFEGQRWNALYYTKSYEAGRPLLARTFSLSRTNNQPSEGYTPVHLFGETVCFDLNKYNFEGDTSIYLSVKQSKNNKSAVADVPEIVGSVFGAGYLFLAGGIGAVVGVGGTVLTRGLVKKKRSKATADDGNA